MTGVLNLLLTPPPCRVHPLQTRDRIQIILAWVARRPLLGGCLLVVLYSVALVLMFPSVILSLAGGAIFGVYVGTFLAWLGTSIGQTLAFMAGRYLLRDMVLTHVTKRYPKWPVIDQVAAHNTHDNTVYVASSRFPPP